MNFWKGKKVFITGHTGFKGSWLVLWLNKLEAEVTGYSLEEEQNFFFKSAGLDKLITSFTGDIRNLEFLAETLHACSPDIVIHMAAQSLVRPSYDAPVNTFSTNVMGTVNILEAVRQTDSVKAVVIVTSDKCYENREWVWGYREQDPMGGHDPYSASKGCAELVTSAYRKSFFQENQTAIATVRAGNVIGGGDWSKDRIIPDIMRAIGKGESVVIRNPTAIRPWQHVCEPLSGYLLLAEQLYTKGSEYADCWNFGPDNDGAWPVSWLIDYICSKWGDNAGWDQDSRVHPHEANFLKLDCSKAKSRLGWKPLLTIESALDWTIEWYKSFYNGADILTIMELQIASYLKLSK